MATTIKISALPPVTVPALTDILPVVQGSVTKQETLSQVKTLFGLPIAALTDGQVVIGATAGPALAANLTAGPGISIANGPNTITISGTGAGIGWTEVTGATQAMSPDSGYVANRGTLITFSLPTTAAFGTALSIIGKGAGLYTVTQAANQQIIIGSSATTVGVAGSITATNQFDSINLICTVADLVWTVSGGPQGIFTVV